MNDGEEDVDHAWIMPHARPRAERFIQAIRVASRQLRARPNPEHREIAQRGLADIGKRGKRLNRFHLRHGHLYNTDAMSVRLLHPPYRRVPWKNGLGTTLEIATDAAEPGGPWSWRLSLADVPSRAPFSMFPGVDRHLAVLDGAGMTFQRVEKRAAEAAHTPIAIPREGRAFEFAGEESCIGEPIGPHVRDVNLMLDRRRWRGSLEILRTASERSVATDADLTLVFAAQGTCFLSDETKHESLTLSAGSTVLLEGHATIVASSGTFIVARLRTAGRNT